MACIRTQEQMAELNKRTKPKIEKETEEMENNNSSNCDVFIGKEKLKVISNERERVYRNLLGMINFLKLPLRESPPFFILARNILIRC